MNRPIHRTSSRLHSWARLLTCGCVTAAALIGTARADDSEIYISQSAVAPNIMLILDTSGSMSGDVTTQAPYDSARDYLAEATGDCASIAGRVFFKTSDQGIPPSCSSGAYISAANVRCAAAIPALASSSGSYQGDRFTQWRRSTGDNPGPSRTWRTLSDVYDTPIDCRNDNGVDGNLTASAPYPNRNASSTNDTAVWSNSANNSYWSNNGTQATLYSANYVAYYEQFANVTVVGTRLSVMQQAATNLLNAVSNVNVGLMRYSVNVDTNGRDDDDTIRNGGGMVLAPVAPIEQNRAQLTALIQGFIPGGNTPLSETLYEAHQYFTGGPVFFGNTSQACSAGTNGTCSGNAVNLRSVAASRVGGTATGTNYASPATDTCQKNFIIYLTDGEPTSDSKANGLIRGLPGFGTLVPGGCAADGQGACLGALSEYMFERDLRGGVSGEQNVTSYYIGFGSAFGSNTSNAAFQFLANAASRGGGSAYQAGDLSELTRVFTDIFNAISSNSSTLTAPTVAVNAFNRTQTLNDLYISVFQPASGLRWPGNVKKYLLDDDDITVLARGRANAIGANGMFLDSTSDYWSRTNADGGKVEVGGATRMIPPPAERKVYTYLGTNPGTATGVGLANNAQAVVGADNALITDEVLGTDTSNPMRDALLNWARGADVDDEDGDSITDEPRFAMGDPMHSQPAVVIYGGAPDDKDSDDAVVFTATNDGYLHAFSTTTGAELWSYIPKEMLPGLKPLFVNDNSVTKNYAIDGDLQALKYDTNADGVIDPDDADRVFLFFSTGRNSTESRYYALDVTSKTAPRFLWSIGNDELPGLGQAWSRPTFTRVNVSDKDQNTQRLVLIFGGGYDPMEEDGAFVDETAVGNRLFMVDVLRGGLLWSAGNDGTDLELERMTHSIPAAVNVLDLDGDGFADRMYVGDMAAQLWRFDIFNGKESSELVTGGVIASLGAKDETAAAGANTRRFYNSPDSAVLQGTNQRPFMNIAIGSGYRGHPLATTNEDRFYSIRDYQPYAKLTQAQYGQLDILSDADLDDVTTNFAPQLDSNSRGWKLQLNFPTYRGEKVLSASTTFNNKIFFTTYTPSASASSNTCSVAVGSNRAYAISAFDGSPLPRRDTPTTPPGPNDPPPPPPGPEDRYADIGQTGIAPGVTILFPDKDEMVCLAGVEVLDVCEPFNSRIKTYWRQTNAN